MSRPLLVGVQLPEVEREVPFAELIPMARAAEAVGFDSIWVGDHLLYDLEVGPRGPHEVWTTLAALAACTERVQLGPLVASTSFHEPAMLAKLAATVDSIAEGRLVLGLGAGWNLREYTAFGFPYDRRVSRFEEAFTIVRTLLTEGRSTFTGEFNAIDDCVLHPAPFTPGGPPLMVGSTGPRMLSITLPHVQMWNVWWSDYGNTPEGFGAVRAEVDDAIAAAGRTGEVDGTCAVYVQLSDGGGRPMGDYPAGPIEPLRGDASEIAEHLRRFARAGAHHVQLVIDPITQPSIEWFAEVFTHLDR